MKGVLKNLADFIFPRECHVCGNKLADHERFVCTHCVGLLPRTGYHRRDLNPMEERFAGQFRFEKATGHFFYTRDSALSQLVQDMKYRHFPEIGDMLGELVASELYSTGFFSGIDVIAPVPMHYLKQARRGYNQVAHIAGGIGKVAGIPVDNCLKAVRSHHTQTAFGRDERLDNMSGVFKVTDISKVKGKHVMLVDDICTTGATLSSASLALWEGEPAELTLFTIGVTF